MALYPPPSHNYGQVPAYPQQNYYRAAEMPPSNLYYPPAPVFHVDPNAFREDYLARLGQLNVNSRVIIQNLSMIAQEYSRWGEIVAQCIEVHIRRAPPWMKLPAFYLLDAMSKNLYDEYAHHFIPFVISLFLDTYEQVDQPTRQKMEEMLLTWRTGSPNRKELFGIGPQVSIERAIWDGGDAAYTETSRRKGVTPVSKAQVLSELDFTLNQKERAAHANPFDTTIQTHLNVLRQLRVLVEAGVSQDELRDVLGQLRAMTRSSAPPAPPPTMSLSAPAYSAPQPQQPVAPVYPSQSSYSVPSLPSVSSMSSIASVPSARPVPSIPPMPSNFAGPSQPQLSSYIPPQFEQPRPSSATLSNTASSQPSTSSSTAPSAAPLGDIRTLFSALVKAGVVSATATPTGAGDTTKAEDTKPAPIDVAREAARDYRAAVLSHDIKLTNADITRKRLNIVHLLYERLPVQCKQCGIRFTDSPTGKKKMDDHLDMHFRQNRKASQNFGRGHSRCWFVGVEDWINELPDSKGKGRAERPLSAKEAAAVAAAQEEAALRASFVVVPPGDEAKPISCPVCKETLKSEFLEDDEEWVWKNATRRDDKIYHATCHAEAASSNRIAALVRSDKAGRSRSRTPETSSRLPTPPGTAGSVKSGVRQIPTPTPEAQVAGTKRKAEDDANPAPLKIKSEGTPPLKKMAVSMPA